MEQERIFSYLEEVKVWTNEVGKIMSCYFPENRFANKIEEELSVLQSKINLIINNQPIKPDKVKLIQEIVEKLSMDSHQFLSGNDIRNIPNQRVPIGKHILPPLPYPYNALEPYISEEIMRLHHGTHHNGYVNGLNKAEKMLEKARLTNNYELLKYWEGEAAFHGSGHYLHTIFWFNMKPKGGGEPHGSLLEQIRKDFGSFDQFKEHFTEAAKKVEGVGWSLLVWGPRSHRLEILQTEKHQVMTQWDTIPLLVLDVWEHAYYLQYKANKEDYIKNWWKVINWDEVEMRFDQASKLKWKSF